MLSQVVKPQKGELKQLLERESRQWRTDSWALKKMVGVAKVLEEVNPKRSEFIKEFLRSKKNSLPVEGQDIIEYGI